MKTGIVKIVSAVLMVTASMSACKKDDKGPSGFSTEKIAGSYKIAAFTATVNNTPVDVLDSWDECEKDDIQVLKSDLTYTSIDAGETCADSGEDEGTWKVEGTKLTIDGEVFNIDSFEGNQLKLSGAITINNNDVPVKVTYVKQ